MPSIQDKMCILNNSTVSKELPSTSQAQSDFLSKDMENLVSEIKENLKLSNFKVKNQRKGVRCRPYTKPSRSCDDTMDCSVCSSCSTSKSICSHVSSTSKRYSGSTGHIDASKLKENSDSPYEMLQELLKDGSLIKEAVRRLQKGLSPKQRYFYESEDDSARSSPLPNLDFVC